MFGFMAGGTAVLRRNMSACTWPVLFWKPSITPEGRPVNNTAARSSRDLPDLFRASRFGKAPGYRTGSRPASSGLVTNWAKFLSSEGCEWFHSSLRDMGISTSLTSGLPSRDTWVHGPDHSCLRLTSSHSLTCCRRAAVHTPITAAGLLTSLAL